MKYEAIVLAAGQGTRMKSDLPKVLHTVAGLSLVAWVIEAALEAGVSRAMVVVGHKREQVEVELRARFGERVAFAVQSEQRGTGHAVLCGMNALATSDATRILVACGDTPLVTASDFLRLMAVGTPLVSVMTSVLADATGYGRILRDKENKVSGIREQKDCSEAEHAITEWNTGNFSFDRKFLESTLPKLSPQNAQGELYLTDLVSMAYHQNGTESAQMHPENAIGINDRAQLAHVEKIMRLRINERWARTGVTFRDLFSAHVHRDVVLEADVTLDANVQLRGKTHIARGAHIDVGCVLTDVRIEAEAKVLPYTVATRSVIGARAQVGPFSHLRPDSVLGPETHIGNFVETKKTTLGKGSKANHLAYLGDGQIGEGVNVGAGTIFCNYDGVRKHTTVLEDGAFIGSDSQLVAPVRIGKNAYVGTGTTVTRDVPEDALAISRVKQDNKEGYAAKLRARFAAEKK